MRMVWVIQLLTRSQSIQIAALLLGVKSDLVLSLQNGSNVRLSEFLDGHNKNRPQDVISFV